MPRGKGSSRSPSATASKVKTPHHPDDLPDKEYPSGHTIHLYYLRDAPHVFANEKEKLNFISKARATQEAAYAKWKENGGVGEWEPPKLPAAPPRSWLRFITGLPFPGGRKTVRSGKRRRRQNKTVRGGRRG